MPRHATVDMLISVLRVSYHKEYHYIWFWDGDLNSFFDIEGALL